ncbi:MAG: alpha/beta fold hydrolase [Chloroflexi bacterium]|nr:alpha/beta fold hydrolase [Chloroflexota bacterium]
MATFVIVHGRGTGGWSWKRVRPLLQAAGHEVFTPTLTGLGERAHLAHPDVDLETHIQDVVGVLAWEDLHKVVLVGHSYGGMVVTGAADRVPERLAHVIYLDARVPQDGEAVVDTFDAAMRAAFDDRVRTEGDGWLVPVGSPHGFGITDEADLRWWHSLQRPQPIRTFTQPIRLANPAAAAIPRTYIACVGPAPASAALSAMRTQARQVCIANGWRHVEMDTAHEPHITHPQALVDLFLEIAVPSEKSQPHQSVPAAAPQG